MYRPDESVYLRTPKAVQEIVDVDLLRARDLDSFGYLARTFRVIGMSLPVAETTAA